MGRRLGGVIGWTGAGALTALLVCSVMLPAVLLPLWLARLLPGAEPGYQFTWWQLPLVAIGLFVVLQGFESLAWRLPLLLTPLRHTWYVAWGHELVELAAMAWVYTSLVRPWPVAVLSAAVVTLLGLVLDAVVGDAEPGDGVSAAPPRS